MNMVSHMMVIISSCERSVSTTPCLGEAYYGKAFSMTGSL